jgi:hypothetical protein
MWPSTCDKKRRVAFLVCSRAYQPRMATTVQPSPRRTVFVAGPAAQWVFLSSHPYLPLLKTSDPGRGPSLHERYLASSLLRPSRHRLAFSRFPGGAGYATDLLHRLLDGTRPVSPVARHVLIHRAAPNHPPEWPAASSARGLSCCLGPDGEGSASGITFCRGHHWVHLRCGPMTRSPSRRWLCRSASSASFPPQMRPVLQGSDSYPGGTDSH